MKIIREEKLDREVKDQEIWGFDVERDGVYIISVSARCKNWLQNFKHLFDDDDLAVQIDDYLFAEIKGKKREFATSGSWNGNEIKNNTKTTLFIMPLKNGAHKITFWVGSVPFVEEISIYSIEGSEIDLVSSKIIAFGKFLDIVIKNLKIENLNVTAKANISSKLEIIIDDKVQKNPKYKRFEKWYWYGKELKGSSKDYVLSGGFDDTKHTLQFVGEGNPEVDSIKLKINMEDVVYQYGYIRLYKDIQDAPFVRLRSTPSDENNETLIEIKDGERVAIHREIVLGKYIENLSETWHEIIFNGIRGFVLSSFVEIDGQEREKVIDLIREKCNQYGIDSNIMLALAGHESHFKPYARSYKEAQGIFQLTEGTATQVKVTDRYNMYKNIDGGVRYYKELERRITGRGDILVKRLAAWRDGPTITLKTIRAGTFSYDKLSNETKALIKSVSANIEKRDWYHIIFLPILAIFLISPFFFEKIIPSDQILQSASAVQVLGDINDGVTPLPNSEYFSDTPDIAYVPNISSFFDFDYPHKKYLKYPRVFLEESTNQVVFLNSNRNMMKTINVARLDLDKNLDISADFLVDYPHHNFITYVVFEYPQNIFYFGATDSASCGASNCWFVLYRFDADVDKLEVIDRDVFGEIMGMYISPDGDQLALVSGESGGTCLGHDSITIYDISNFYEQKVEGFYLDAFGNNLLNHLSWESNNKIDFNINYTNCPLSKITKISWSYDVMKGQIKEIKREVDSYGI